MNRKTIDYYNKNYRTYHRNTFNIDMADIYEEFEGYLKGSRILDLGCGSGRDLLYFKKKGYDILGIDLSERLLEMARENKAGEVRLMDILDMDFNREFDGIWACASMVHLSDNEMGLALDRIYQALDLNGIVYMSFKEGNFKGYIDERYFNYLDWKSLEELIDWKKFRLESLFYTGDRKSDRQLNWINIILSKK